MMDLKMSYGRSKTKKQIPYEIAYMWNLNKNGANELSYKIGKES